MTAQLLAAAGLAALALGLSACQSTQDKSAELEKEGAGTLIAEKGLEIKKRNPDVEVVFKALLGNAEGNAVVVAVHNDSDADLVDVPILIDVRDAKGKTVYSNDIPGIEPALASISFIPANGNAEWVDDQVFTTGKPKSVDVKVGAGGSTFRGEMPAIEVSQPHLEGDPVSGISATGTVVNRTGSDQGRLLLYVVARRGDEVVAAGRGAIEHLKPETKALKYTVFFIGDPSGAELKLTELPTLSGSEGGPG
ncbi:MAG TPA: hypothetical protein VHQ43_06465 [Solirubrobacterales bacterium]|jgi:hypothetical protein|nr:hypothetical protein [Solirubrobacterales bacterium]